MTRAELQSIRRAFEERSPKRLLVGETRLLFDHITTLEEALEVRVRAVSNRLTAIERALELRATRVDCRWCAQHPGETHHDATGAPLFDLLHHAGQYVTPDGADRISADGP